MQLSKRVYGIFFALFAVFFMAGNVYAAPSDIGGHWAYANINEWVSKGYISGYEDGTFRPDNTISRAEFTALATRAFNVNKQAGIAFSDVSTDDWFYDAVSKGVGAGYLSGYPDNTFQPRKEITREEAAVILCNILGQGQSPEHADGFSDSASLSWSKGFVGTCVRLGVLRGDTGGTFRPGDNMTRAEAVTCLNAALTPASVTPSVTPPIATTPNTNQNQTVTNNEKLDNVTITTANYGPSSGKKTLTGKTTVKGSHSTVKLQNLDMDELVVSQGAGTLELDNVTVKKLTNNSSRNINMNGSTVDHLINNNTSAATTVDNVSKSLVKESTLYTSATLKDSYKSSSYGFTNVNIPDSDVKKNSTFTLRGDFNTVNTEAENVTVNLREGSISRLNIASSARSSEVNVASGTTVDRAVIDARNSKISGTGTVRNASVNASGVTLNKRPDNVSGSYSPNYGSGGSSSGGSNLGNNSAGSGRYTYTFKVSNSVGAPVNGATIRIDGNTATTNTSGEARFYLDSGTYSYRITKSDFTERTGNVTIRSNNNSNNYTLNNRTTYNVTFITQNSSGAPINAYVTATGYTVRETAAANGTLTMAMVPGYYAVSISKTGYTTDNFNIEVSQNNTYTRKLSGGSGQTTSVTFNVVEDVTPNPPPVVASASVAFNGETKTTGADGKVTFNNVSLGNKNAVVSKDGFTAKTQPVLVAAGMNPVEVRLARATTGTVEFTMKNSSNQDITSVNFTAALTPVTNGAAVSPKTNMGKIEFTGVVPGTYSYKVTGPGYVDHNSSANITVTAGQVTKVEPMMTTTPSTSTVSFTVTVKNTENNPITTGAIGLAGGATISPVAINGSGEAVFTNVPVDNYTYTLTGVGTAYKTTGALNVTAGMDGTNTTVVTVPFETAKVTFNVTGNTHNVPIDVTLHNDTIGSPLGTKSGTSQIVFDNIAVNALAGNTFSYAVDVKGFYDPVTIANFTLTPGQQNKTESIALVDTGVTFHDITFDFSVDFTGQTITGTLIGTDPLGSKSFSESGGPAGTVHTIEAPNGTYTLTIDALPGFQVYTIPVMVSGADVPLGTIPLAAGAPPVAPGSIVLPQGAPVQAAEPEAAPVPETDKGVILPPAELKQPPKVVDPAAPVPEITAPAPTPAPIVTEPVPAPATETPAVAEPVPTPEAPTPAPVPEPVAPVAPVVPVVPAPVPEPSEPAPAEVTATGTVIFNITAGEGAEVTLTVGGKTVKTGGGPLSVSDLAPGYYRYAASSPGCKTVYGVVRVVAGGATSVNVVLTPASAEGAAEEAQNGNTAVPAVYQWRPAVPVPAGN